MAANKGYDFPTLNARLLSQGEALLFHWFSDNGHVLAGEFCVGNLRGDAGKSLKVNLHSGVWCDFATGEKGADLISLYAAMHSLSQSEAYRALSGERAKLVLVKCHQPIVDTSWQFAPVPEHVQHPLVSDFVHPQYNAASAIYCYRDQHGELLYVVGRYEGKGSKKFCPWIWKADAWRPEAPPAPRPLYGLERLTQHNVELRVIVVEGEKCADALRAFLAQPILTWSNGAAAARKADWKPLAGRRVLIWPDADDAGLKAAQDVLNALLKLNCHCSLIDVSGYSGGWDAADWCAAQSGACSAAALSTWLATRTRAFEAQAPVSAVNEAEEVRDESSRVLWRAAGLACSKSGAWANIDNVQRMLCHAEGLEGHTDVWYDTFLQRVLYAQEGVSEPQEWADEHDTRLTAWIQRRYDVPGLRVDVCKRAVRSYARSRARNQVRDWLMHLTWDNEERLSALLSMAFGCASDAYHAAVGRCFMLGMVARVMHPGCKCDCMPVLEGEQGTLKSQALQILGGEWFAEVHDTILSKDFMISIQGKLLVEIAELHAFSRAQKEAIKGRISCQIDRFRAPYESNARDWPRQGVFAGTTNYDDWNRDETGARRFWPVRCGPIMLEYLRESREQLFAEALVRYQRGESWWDVPEQAAREAQEQRREQHPWHEIIAYYVRDSEYVVINDVMRHALEIKTDKLDLAASRVIGVILRDLGFRKCVRRDEDERQYKAWRRAPERARLAPRAQATAAVSETKITLQ